MVSHTKISKLLLTSFLIILFTVVRVTAQNPAPASEVSNQVPATVHPLKAEGIENFYQLSDRIYSGSAPEGDAAFAALKERGIKTIITVDGTKPDVERAKKFGLRYVHLPIGYDGVPAKQAERMVKAAETLPGPIYVHCHHGLHRGPAGAAVICMAMDGWSAEQADAWLHLAGTATNYAGLYKSVAQFKPPTVEELKSMPANFPETAEVSPLADEMIRIDGQFDTIKLLKKAGYEKTPAHPDLDPVHEALLFNELFKELLRSPVTEKRTADFRVKLTAAEEASDSLHQIMALKPLDLKKADAAFQRMNDACAACHKVYRN